MVLDSIRYTLPSRQEAVALVNLENFVAARPTRYPPTAEVPFISVHFVRGGFEQTMEQWQDLKGKLAALLSRGRNSLEGTPPLPDPAFARPPRDPGNPFSVAETIEAIRIGPEERTTVPRYGAATPSVSGGEAVYTVARYGAATPSVSGGEGSRVCSIVRAAGDGAVRGGEAW